MSTRLQVVALVDDDASFLRSASRLLRAAGYTVESFSSAELYLAQLTDTPGCVVADLHMPGLSGIELQAALEGEPHAPPVIFLTGQGDIASAVRAMRNGAEDFLTKDAAQADLLQAVERALARDARQREQGLHLQSMRGRFDALSPREHEVLQQVLRGARNKQIANALGISERTVKLHRTAITNKLQLHSVAELTRLAQAAGLFDENASTFPKG